MSGRATGWVLMHGPRPETLDREGVRYGDAKARAMRAVLIAIADAANQDGEHAHPGIEGMISASLYKRRAVQTTVAALVDEGWVEVTEQGGGRGKATTYRVLMNRAQDAPFAEAKPRTADDERVQSQRETAHSLVGVLPTVVTTELLNEPPTAAPPTASSSRKKPVRDDDVTRTADRLTRDEWDRRKAAHVEQAHGGFIAMRARIVEALDAGVSADRLAAALPDVSVWTRGGLELALARRSAHPRREQRGRLDDLAALHAQLVAEGD